MRLLQVAPYAAFVLLGQAALDSVPGVVAAREGGMGLGSALISAQLTQVAGIALGAVAAAYLIERWSIRVALVIGALAVYAGLVGVGHQPMHSLVWVIVVHGIGGAGLGAVLTSSFCAAAGVDRGTRPFAIVLLLLASLLGRDLLPVVYLPGAVTLAVAGAVLVGGATWIARSVHADAAAAGRDVNRPERSTPRLTARTAVVGGALLAIGVLATLWGADPSRVSTTLLARFLGVTALDALDGIRAGAIVFGLVAVGAAAALLLIRRRPGRGVALAATGVAAAAFAAAGVLAAIRFGAAPDGVTGGSAPGWLGAAAALGGGAAGLLVGGWALSRGGSRRLVAAAGSLLVVGATVVVLVVALGPLDGGAPVATAVIMLAAVGGGLVATALRLVLAEMETDERAFAAAAGVVGGSYGLMAGLLVGAGEGMRATSAASSGISAASLLLVGTALAALAAAMLIPSARPEPIGP